MADRVPASLRPPVALTLAKAVTRLPSPGSMPGGALYEPKWDGFRLAIFRDGEATSLWSRQGKDLTRHFPDLAAAAAEQIPAGCVLDGEAVVWSGDRLDFTSLQQRLTASRKALSALVQEHPASFAAFDVLAVAGHDTRDLPLSDRRALLEELAKDWRPPLNLSPSTADAQTAQRWFEELASMGVEGLVIKSSGQKYSGGQRQWLKYKSRETVEVICGAVVGPITRPSQVVAGLILDGRLRIVGRSTMLKAAAARELATWLEPPHGAHPWPETVKGTALDKFNRDKDPVSLTLVEPMVVEVTADTAWSGQSFRHPLRFVRVRPEMTPQEVTPREIP